MSRELDLRTTDLKKLLDAFETERDKLLDQVQYLKGSAERLEWVIKVLNGQLDWIQKDQKQKEVLAQQQEAALVTAKEKGNVGIHPADSQRSADLASRRERMTHPDQQNTSSEEEKKKKK